MRFGVCAAPSQASLFRDQGFDYLELAAGSFLDLDEKEFGNLGRSLHRAALPVEAVNCFFPSKVRVTGPEVEPDLVRSHAAKLLDRASRLGVRIAVVGSGGARNVPEGFPMDLAREQFREALLVCADLAAERNIRIVIEPLHRGETNLVNRYAEAALIAEEAGHPALSALVDAFHLYKERESLLAILRDAEVLAHAHIASGEARLWPTSPDDHESEHFVEALASAGYDGRLSVEGRSESPVTDGPRALHSLRLWAERADRLGKIA